MQALSPEQITIDPAAIPQLRDKPVELSVLRLDKIHPVISGNKWFKLKFYLRDALESGKKNIITFGGAWSNHIVATAAACRLHGLNAVGIIRGEEVPSPSPTLLQARELGMQLVFTGRRDYAEKNIPARYRRDEFYLIPEGGLGELGAKGAATIASLFENQEFTHLGCAVGSGTMMAGLINAAKPGQSVFGISVMKNNYALEDVVRSLTVNKQETVTLLHDYHAGGYAKHTNVLLDFMNDFFRQTGIPSDFVYTGKLFYATADLVKRDFFPAGSRVLLIHSGGLQGNSSLGKGTLIF